MTHLQLRLCPSGQPTTDVFTAMPRVPCVGELVDWKGTTYRVVDVHWYPTDQALDDGDVLVVAHTLDRPRAERVGRGCAAL